MKRKSENILVDTEVDIGGKKSKEIEEEAKEEHLSDSKTEQLSKIESIKEQLGEHLSDQKTQQLSKIESIKEQLGDIQTELIGLQQLVEECKSNKDDFVGVYISTSPECKDLFRMFDSNGWPPPEKLALIWELFYCMLLNCSEHKESGRGSFIASKLLQNHIKVFYSSLSTNISQRVSKAALKCITIMLAQSTQTVREFITSFDFSLKGLKMISHSRDRKQKPDLRTCFVQFVMAFFIFGDQQIIKEILEEKGLLGLVLQDLHQDSDELIGLVLNTIQDKVITESLLKKTKLNLFNANAMSKLTILYKNHNEDIQKLVHSILKLLSTDIKVGICFTSSDCLTQKCINPVLLKFLLSITQLTMNNQTVRELAFQTLKTCPDLIIPYVNGLKLQVEPRNSDAWIKTITFVNDLWQNLLKVSDIIVNYDSQHFKKFFAQEDTVCKLIVPSLISKMQLVSGLKNKSSSVKLLTMKLVITIMNRVIDIIENIADNDNIGPDKLISTWQDRIFKCLPEVTTVISIRQMTSSDKDDSMESWEKEDSLLESSTKLLYLYQSFKPGILTASGFNVCKLLLFTIGSEPSQDVISLSVKTLLLEPVSSANWVDRKLPSNTNILDLVISRFLDTETSEARNLLSLLFSKIFNSCSMLSDSDDLEAMVWLDLLYSHFKNSPNKDSISTLFSKACFSFLSNPYSHIDVLLEAVSESNVDVSDDKMIPLSPLFLHLLTSKHENEQILQNFQSYIMHVLASLMIAQPSPVSTFLILEHAILKLECRFPQLQKFSDMGHLICDSLASKQNNADATECDVKDISIFLLEDFNDDVNAILIMLNTFNSLLIDQDNSSEIWKTLITKFQPCVDTAIGSKNWHCKYYLQCVFNILQIILSKMEQGSSFVTEMFYVFFGYMVQILKSLYSEKSNVNSLEKLIDTFVGSLERHLVPNMSSGIFALKLYNLVMIFTSSTAVLTKAEMFSMHAVECLKQLSLSQQVSEDLLEICTSLLKSTLNHCKKEVILDLLNTVVDVLGTVSSRKSEISVEFTINRCLPVLLSSLQNLTESNETHNIKVDSLKKIFIMLPSHSSLCTAFLKLYNCSEKKLKISIKDIDSLLKDPDPECHQIVVSLLKNNASLQEELEDAILSRSIQEDVLLSHYLPAVCFLLENSDDDNIDTILFDQCWDVLQSHIQQIGDGHVDPAKDVNHVFKALKLLMEFADGNDILQLLDTLLNASRNSDQCTESFVAGISSLSLDALLGNISDKNNEKFVAYIFNTLFTLLFNESANHKYSDRSVHGETLEGFVISNMNKCTDFILKNNIEIRLNHGASLVDHWADFVKTVLKKRFKQADYMKCFGSIVETVYKIKIFENKTSVSLEMLHELIISHSKFLNVMFDTGDDEKVPVLKGNILNLVLKICLMKPDICSSSLLNIYKAAYNGTMSSHDQTILMLLQLYEKQGIAVVDQRPFVWGKLALESLNSKKSGDGQESLVPNYTSIQVFKAIDVKIMMKSTSLFPLNRPLEVSFDTSSDPADCYDPAFFLPMFSNLLCSQTEVDCRQFIDSGCLSFVVAALGSTVESVRQAAYHILSEFNDHLEKAYFREKGQIAYLLMILKDSITEENMRLPCVWTVFISRCFYYFLRPEQHLYTILNSSMLQKATFNFRELPLFLSLFNSSSFNHQMERHWVLRLMTDGLRDAVDYYLMKRHHVFELIMSYFDSPLSEATAKSSVLKILSQASLIHPAGYDLVQNFGLLSWLHLQILHKNTLSSHKSEMISILHQLNKTFEKGHQKQQKDPEANTDTSMIAEGDSDDDMAQTEIQQQETTKRIPSPLMPRSFLKECWRLCSSVDYKSLDDKDLRNFYSIVIFIKTHSTDDIDFFDAKGSNSLFSQAEQYLNP